MPTESELVTIAIAVAGTLVASLTLSYMVFEARFKRSRDRSRDLARGLEQGTLTDHVERLALRDILIVLDFHSGLLHRALAQQEGMDRLRGLLSADRTFQSDVAARLDQLALLNGSPSESIAAAGNLVGSRLNAEDTERILSFLSEASTGGHVMLEFLHRMQRRH